MIKLEMVWMYGTFCTISDPSLRNQPAMVRACTVPLSATEPDFLHLVVEEDAGGSATFTDVKVLSVLESVVSAVA